MRLSILCITKVESYTEPFLRDLETLADRCHAQLVLACDGEPALRRAQEAKYHGSLICLKSSGYLENIHDRALQYCIGEYVLRLDDDEKMSPAGCYWMKNQGYRITDHWKFARAHFWGDTKTVLTTPHLWPDHQTRLSTLAKSDGRTMVHCGSPYGGGAEAPVCIEHHKFLVKTLAQRQDIAVNYDKLCVGFGSGNMLPFNCPELAYKGEVVPAASYTDGQLNTIGSFGPRDGVQF